MDEGISKLLAEGKALRDERIATARAAYLEKVEANNAKWEMILDKVLPLVHPALVPYFVDPRHPDDYDYEAPDLFNGSMIWLSFDVPEIGELTCGLDVGWISDDERSFTVNRYKDSEGWCTPVVDADNLGVLLLEMSELAERR